jgi:RNA polymerase sigma-70 factor (ECF subfamily)
MADRGRQYLILADEDLISLVEAGDAEAFATLYDRHSRAAISLAHRMMGERQAAEDLAQDAFVKVWRGGKLQGRKGERADLDPLYSPQLGNRPAALAGEPPQDAGQDRGLRPALPAERGLRRDLEKLPGRAGARGPRHPTARAATDTGAGVLLGVHARRDSRARGPAARDAVKGRMRLGLKKIRAYFESRDAAVPR